MSQCWGRPSADTGTGWAVVDVETTGFRPGQARVVSIAAVAVGDDGSVEHKVSSLLNPGVDPGPTHVHGLTADMLAGQPTFADIAPQLMQVLRAILFMTASMACLALSDLFIKLSAQSLPPGQVMFFLSLGGTLLFMLIAALRGIPLVSPAFWHPTVMSRNLAEVLAALGMVTGIAWTPLPMVAG